MLCDDCIIELSDNLSEEAIKILVILSDLEDGASRSKIQREWLKKFDEELTYSVFQFRITELESVMFVTHKVFSQTKVYGVDDAGYRFLEIVKEG